MGTVGRTYTTYRLSTWEDVQKIEELARRWLAVGKRLGFPPDRFYRYVSVGPETSTPVAARSMGAHRRTSGGKVVTQALRHHGIRSQRGHNPSAETA